MKKTLFILLCLSMPFAMFGQNPTDSIRSKSARSIVDTTYFNKDWKKSDFNSADYYRVRLQIDSGFTIGYYSKNSTPIENGQYLSLSPEIKHGHFITYFENGVKSSEYNCINDTIRGEAIDYYPNGMIKKKYNFSNNIINGESKSYSSDGILNSIELFKDNYLNGLSVYYINGSDSGYIERVYDNGVLVSSVATLVSVKKKEIGDKQVSLFDVAPEFSGGDKAWMEFLRKNLQYPVKARAEGIGGTVYVEFAIEIDGTISNPFVKRDIGGGCGEEVLRIIRLMPRWEPGMKNGKPVITRFVLPVKFGMFD